MRLFLLTCLSALSLTAHATLVNVQERPCPLGDGVAKVYDKVAANTAGGFDSDGARYSSKGQFREYAIATCSNNLFTLYGEDMDQVFDEETALRLNTALDQARAQLEDPDNPTIWERYGIAARMYQELGRDPLFVATVYVQASWTARDAAVGVYPGLEGPLAAQNLLREGAKELDKDLSPAQRKTVLYNLARVAERGGYPTLRDSYLDRFVAVGGLSDTERQAVERFRTMTQQIEPLYQDLAIAQLTQGLRRPGIPMEDKTRSTYLLADLLRRRGDLPQAQALFTLVLDEDQAPMNLREMALVLARELAGDDPLPMDALAQ